MVRRVVGAVGKDERGLSTTHLHSTHFASLQCATSSSHVLSRLLPSPLSHHAQAHLGGLVVKEEE